MDYLYDSTYTGLMTALYIHYRYKESSGIFSKKSYQKSLMVDYKIVKSNEEFSSKMEDIIKKRISKTALKLIYYTFLSTESKKERYIVNFIDLGFIKGNITQLYSHEDTFPIQNIYDKVSKEKHRFLGILRFKDLNGVLFSKISPDNDIVELIMPHFADRFKSENFIIFDDKRLKAGIYNQKQWYITNIDEKLYSKFSDVEEVYEEMWKEYFKAIGIKDRKNTKAQFQFLPARYRKNIIEFNK
ncbi:MAG: TIGR03915 family putative DNA repair protein [Bacillota bacterium]|nr:TIGR03915 family putative DNA repair protein [Bacillota bacterium]